MEDFTYAGLLALLERVVADHDPALLGGIAVADPMKGARADAARKLSRVERVMAGPGPGLLLSVAQHLDLADKTPALTVLTRPATPSVVAEKFMRLERYHHSSHRGGRGGGRHRRRDHRSRAAERRRRPMTAFAAAIGVLFGDPNLSVEALYRSGGDGEAHPVRIMRRAPDSIGDFGSGR